MYSHETFMNFVFPPHLVTVIKARVRIQAARLPLNKRGPYEHRMIIDYYQEDRIDNNKKNTRLTSICCIQHHIIISYPVPAELRLPGVPMAPPIFGSYRNLTFLFKWPSMYHYWVKFPSNFWTFLRSWWQSSEELLPCWEFSCFTIIFPMLSTNSMFFVRHIIFT